MHSSYSDCIRSGGEVIERNNVIPPLNVAFILAITCSHRRHTDLSLDQWVAVLHSGRIGPAAG